MTLRISVRLIHKDIAGQVTSSMESRAEEVMLELGEGELVLLRQAFKEACDHVWVGPSGGNCEKCGRRWGE